MKFIGYGDDGSKDHPYRTVFIAKGQFGAEAPNYDLPFHSMWIGLKGTPSFSMDGTVRLSIDNSGTVTQSMITHLETACRAGDHDSDGDSH
jgi:hypothetical protein